MVYQNILRPFLVKESKNIDAALDKLAQKGVASVQSALKED